MNRETRNGGEEQLNGKILKFFKANLETGSKTKRTLGIFQTDILLVL